MLAVEIFFHLAIAGDLISRVRPKGEADNKVDIAYLYYLPFCHIFMSNDKLHKRVVPLFLRKDQTFVDATDLKADLKKLDDHYSALPDEVKASGFHKFANLPPQDTSFLVTRLWDSLGSGWRDIAANHNLPTSPNIQNSSPNLTAFRRQRRPQIRRNGCPPKKLCSWRSSGILSARRANGSAIPRTCELPLFQFTENKG